MGGRTTEMAPTGGGHMACVALGESQLHKRASAAKDVTPRKQVSDMFD